MANKIKVLAISGSTRQSSSNLNLIKAIADLTSEIFTTTTMHLLHDRRQYENLSVMEPVLKLNCLLRINFNSAVKNGQISELG